MIAIYRDRFKRFILRYNAKVTVIQLQTKLEYFFKNREMSVEVNRISLQIIAL